MLVATHRTSGLLAIENALLHNAISECVVLSRSLYAPQAISCKKHSLLSLFWCIYLLFFLFFVLVSLFCKCSTSTIGKSRLSQRLLWHKLIYFQGKLVNYCSHFFFIPENKMSPNNDIFLKGVLILDFLSNLLASYIL